MYSLLAELSAHDLEVAETLIGVIRFLLIFLAARALAEVLVRLSLPTIVGELLAGVVIGASGFHLLIPPSAGTELNEGLVNVISSLASIPPEAVPDVYFESFPSLQAVATLGLYALLFLTGLESELEELVAVGAQAFTVAMAGVILPFAFGTLGLMFIFQVDLIPAVFAGASMTATSIGITASVFGELGYLKTREGQIVIGAAVLDDILGIVILAVVVALAAGGSLEIAPIVKLVAAAVVFVIAALGAFAAGLILSSSKNNHAIQQSVLPLVSLFATIFFVLVGAGMDLSVINPLDPTSRSALVVAGFLLVVAIIGKIAAGWVFSSDKPTNRLVVGLGMMPRGEVGLIFLGLGTSAKLLTPSLEAAILLMVIGTTFLAPVLLRIVLKDKPPNDGNKISDDVAADPVGLL